MIKPTVTYKDSDDHIVTEDLWFNLKKAEVLELDKKYGGNLTNYLRRWAERKDNVKLAVFFKDFILRSYGVKSEDGKRFVKSDELSRDFYQSYAFDAMFDAVLKDVETAKAFVDGVMAGITEDSEQKAFVGSVVANHVDN